MGSIEAYSGKIESKNGAEKEGEQTVEKKPKLWGLGHTSNLVCQQVYDNCPCVWPKPQQMQILSQ